MKLKWTCTYEADVSEDEILEYALERLDDTVDAWDNDDADEDRRELVENSNELFDRTEFWAEDYLDNLVCDRDPQSNSIYTFTEQIQMAMIKKLRETYHISGDFAIQLKMEGI